MLIGRWRRQSRNITCSLGLALLAGLAACTPAAYGVNEDAVELARVAGVPVVVDAIRVHNGRSNDSYIRLEFTSVDGLAISGIGIQAVFLGADGRPSVNRTTGATVLELALEERFDFRHAGVWGPFFVRPMPQCLRIDAIELQLGSGRVIGLLHGSGLEATLAYTLGDLCR